MKSCGMTSLVMHSTNERPLYQWPALLACSAASGFSTLLMRPCASFRLDPLTDLQLLPSL
jgi:hypothetical protein